MTVMIRSAFLVIAILKCTSAILFTNSTDTGSITSVHFQYYKQVRVHERFTGLSIAEPIQDLSFRKFAITLDAKQSSNTHNTDSLRLMRTRGNLRKLLELCEDDDERLVAHKRRTNWNNIIRLSDFKYHVFHDDTSKSPNTMDDVDNIVANIFITRHDNTKTTPILLIAFSFPELIRQKVAQMELLRAHNSAAMFLCCCGKEAKQLKVPPCGCAIDATTCSRPCMFHQTPSGGLFYHRAKHIIKYVKAVHPDSQVWMTGFGFCGGLAALLTQAFHDADKPTSKMVQAITFHAPGDFWFAQRQGLYTHTAKDPNHRLPIYNIGISSNPIFAKSVGASIHSYGPLYYQTYMRSGVDCVIPTLGEKRLEYHSIGHLEDAIRRLEVPSDWHELQCHVTEYGEMTRECRHYTYSEKDIPSHYMTVMGAP